MIYALNKCHYPIEADRLEPNLSYLAVINIHAAKWKMREIFVTLWLLACDWAQSWTTLEKMKRAFVKIYERFAWVNQHVKHFGVFVLQKMPYQKK